jgi:DNA-binding protein YbaB
MNPFGGDPRKLMKQLQQAQEKIQQEIAALRIEASSGGGMVKVVMNGEKQVVSLTIEAARKVDDEVKNKVGGLTAGLRIPGLS